eukprot:3416592-Amphidinium_carterae.1
MMLRRPPNKAHGTAGRSNKQTNDVDTSRDKSRHGQVSYLVLIWGSSGFGGSQHLKTLVAPGYAPSVRLGCAVQRPASQTDTSHSVCLWYQASCIPADVPGSQYLKTLRRGYAPSVRLGCFVQRPAKQ